MLTIAGATICLSLLCSLNSKNFGDSVVMDGDPAPNLIFVILIPAVDLLLDYSTSCVCYLCYNKYKASRPVESSVVSRLSDSERLLFLLGIAIQTIVLSNSSEKVLSDAFNVEKSIGVFLIVCPIIIYLNRCTTTFTSRRTFSILSTGFIGLTFYTTSYYYQSRQKIASYYTCSFIGNIFMSAAGIILVATILLSFVSFVREKMKCPIAKRIFRRLRLSPQVADAFPEDGCCKIDTNRELYSNYIPALHMVSLVLICVANIYWSFAPLGESAKATICRGYITLAAEILVLVIELRIRKNEIARGLVSWIQLFC